MIFYEEWKFCYCNLSILTMLFFMNCLQLNLRLRQKNAILMQIIFTASTRVRSALPFFYYTEQLSIIPSRAVSGTYLVVSHHSYLAVVIETHSSVSMFHCQSSAPGSRFAFRFPIDLTNFRNQRAEKGELYQLLWILDYADGNPMFPVRTRSDKKTSLKRFLRFRSKL